MIPCQRCGKPATHRGSAYPAGGSFPVVGCVPCLEALASEMSISVAHLDAQHERGHQANCLICGWWSLPWPTHDQAGRNATWHVFKNHTDQWHALFGDTLPRDADPRKES